MAATRFPDNRFDDADLRQHEHTDPQPGEADPDREVIDVLGDSEAAMLLSAAFSLYAATQRLAVLNAEDRAVARLAAEALMRRDVSRPALALVAKAEGRSGLLDLLRGSARSRVE